MSDSQITFDVQGDGQVIARLGQLHRDVWMRLRAAMQRLLLVLRSDIQAQYPTAGLHVRTGNLKGSVTASRVMEEGTTLHGRITVGQALPYGPIQEYGGTVRPKNGRFLAIPVGEALTGAGVARFSPRQITAAGYDGSFIKKGVIFGKKGAQVVPLFVLKPSVTIRPHPFVRPAFLAWRATFEQEMQKAVTG